jgi:hypothetical protein
MQQPGYHFGRADFPTLLLRKFFPERTDGESAVIKDFLLEHIDDYDSFDFSVRIGEGIPPDPTLLPSVQRQATFNSLKRIDILAWRGPQPVIIEVKQRVTPASLGQILTYQHLWMLENPDAPEPELVVVGRSSDPDTLKALQGNGVTVVLYEAPNTAGHDGRGRP